MNGTSRPADSSRPAAEAAAHAHGERQKPPHGRVVMDQSTVHAPLPGHGDPSSRRRPLAADTGIQNIHRGHPAGLLAGLR